MKIIPKEISESAAIQKASPTRPGTGVSFNHILQNAMSNGSQPACPDITLPPAAGIPITALQPTDQGADRKLLEQVDNLISILEDYQQKMDDPRFSLKDVHPLIEKMAAESQKLRPVLEGLPDETPMKDILNRALVSSSVEVIKFNRGDYL